MYKTKVPVERNWKKVAKLGYSEDFLEWLKKNDPGDRAMHYTFNVLVKPPKSKNRQNEYFKGKFKIYLPNGYRYEWKNSEGKKDWFYNFTGPKFEWKGEDVIKIGTYYIKPKKSDISKFQNMFSDKVFKMTRKNN